jgi:hypothetical protein
MAMGAGFYEAILGRFLLRPVARLAEGLASLEPSAGPGTRGVHGNAAPNNTER